MVIADQALVSGSNFITGLVLARGLGLEGYGRFVLAYGLVLFVSGIHVSLVASPMMVFGPKELDEARRKRYYATTIRMQFTLAGATFLLLLGAVAAVAFAIPTWRAESLVLPLAFAASSYVVQDFFRRLFITVQRPGLAMLNDAICYLSQIGALGTLVVVGALSVERALVVIGLCATLALIVGAALARPTLRGASADWLGTRSSAARHWDFGRWLIGLNLTRWSGNQLIIYMSGAILSTVAVGAIGATKNIAGAVNVLFLALDNMLPPAGARIHVAKGLAALEAFLTRASVLGGIATMVVLAIVAGWAEPLLDLAYGEEFRSYGWVMVGWAVYFFIAFFHRPLGAGLKILNAPQVLLRSSLIGMVVALVVGVPALLWQGILGAMVTMCLVQLTMLLVLWRGWSAASTVERTR